MSTVSAQTLAEIITTKAGITVDHAALTHDTRLRDLGVDSLGMLGLVTELERRHGISLPDGTEKAATVGGFIDVVNARIAELN